MLELKNISKSFYRKPVLNDVSFRANKGEIIGLLGPNGAGKTTLIRIINKIVAPSNGTVRFQGDLMTDAHLASVGYLPEERGLYKSMTVENHAVLLGKLRGFSSDDVHVKLNYWLEKFDMQSWRNKRIESLSKGMAQKVQFICTVLHEPDLLILDEPYSGFDPVNVELIKQELVEMRAKGKTIILSTHNMKSVEEVCDRSVLINHGEKVAEGKIADLQASRKTGEFAIKFRGNMISFVNALWVGFELTEKEILADDLFNVRVKMRGENSFDDLLKVLIGQVQILEAREVLPNMQEVFVDIVQPNMQEDEE